jgi:uncharacterized protein (DUF924 family)
MSVDAVLKFWLDEVDQSSWYNSSEALDQEIRDRFLETWHQIMEGGHSMWLTYPSGALAYILVTDQFSRNMFRGSGAGLCLRSACVDGGKTMRDAEMGSLY